jgi:hypothetical protein
MFTSVVAGLKNGPFKTFTDAFVNFYPRVVTILEQGTSLQELDATSRIEGEFTGWKSSLSLSDLRDFAYMVGIITSSGELQIPLPDVDPREVRLAFMTAARKSATATQNEPWPHPADDGFAGFTSLA